MYVCICNAVTDHRIREAVRNGAVSFEQLRDELGVSTNCGSCEDEVRELLAECLEEPVRNSHTPPPARALNPVPFESARHLR